LFFSPVNSLPAAPLAESLVSFSFRRLDRRAARCIARFFLLPTPRVPCRSLYRLFFSPVNLLHTAPLAESLVSFSFPRLAHRAACCIACFSHRTTGCPQRRSLNISFLSLFDGLTAAPLAGSLDSFCCRHHACHAARCIACFSHRSTSYPQRRSLNRSFLSLFHALPAAPLAASLVHLTGQPLARGTACCIACFSHW
jgi:hypothetical protein